MNELINLGNGQFVKVTMLKGERGSNIATVTKTGTSGLTDTYTITLTDGSTTTFEVTNGSSIDHIEKTSTVGSVDTYTIYLTDGTVGGTFEVNNAIATVEQNFSTTSENPLMNKTLTNIISGVENGSTASKTYYANDLILRNDSLYEVTTTVAVGTAWADGVNITEKTLGELISELNSNLTANNNEFIFAYDATSQSYGYKAGGADSFHPFKSKFVPTTVVAHGINNSPFTVNCQIGDIFCGVYNGSGDVSSFFPSGVDLVASSNSDVLGVTTATSFTVNWRNSTISWMVFR